MADTPPATPDAKKPAPSPLVGLAIPCLLILAAAGVFAVFYFLNQKPPAVDPAVVLNGYATNAEKFAKLSTDYTDADADLIADTPKDATEPAELFFTDIPGPNTDQSEKLWAAFLAHMSKETGKPCKYLKAVDAPPALPPVDADGDGETPPADGSVKSFDAQLSAMKSGKLHVTAFSTGQVRQAVNTAGFRPLLVPADENGKTTYQVKVLVTAGSTAKGVADLKGKKVAVPAMSSNSGAKAPFVEFREKFDLHPTKDYTLVITGRYDIALERLAKGEVDAVCIASDLYARGGFAAEKVKELYSFGDFPKVCFGVSHTLPAGLAGKVKAAFASFDFTGTEVGKRYAADGKVTFQAADYKEGWKAVREVDDKLVKLVEKSGK